MEPAIKLARSDEELEQIGRLRYRIFVVEKKLPYPEADHARGLMLDPVDRYSYNYYAEADGEVVGAMRLTVRADGPLEAEDWFFVDAWREGFVPAEIMQITRFGILPAHRKTSVGAGLLLAFFAQARRDGIGVVLYDINPPMIQYYLRLGGLPFHETRVEPTLGIPYLTMAHFPEDVEHHRAVGSPFAELAATGPHSNRGRRFLEKRFHGRNLGS